MLPSDLDAAAFEAFLRQQALGVGLSAEQPFVFRVEGRFPHLLWHVVTGGASAAGSPGGHGGHGAGHANAPSAHEWIVRNQQATISALHRFPGLKSRYERLVAAPWPNASPPRAMPDDEAAQERAVRAALSAPGTVPLLPTLSRAKAKALQPVPLWLYPTPAALPRGGGARPESRKPPAPNRKRPSASSTRPSAWICRKTNRR